MFPGIQDFLLRCHLAQFQSCCAGNNLKRRSRRIFTINHSVLHGVKGIIIDRFPVLFRNTAIEQIRIKRRPADHSQDFARFGIDGNRRAGFRIDIP
ncbi:hypothetical protein SDC9_189350 [bioreactor metagenome]|uniref:Uncharacterized protein n=1 Tax=bioreactor metagenome TaxID=1076179 RepID=A0A645HRW9_9ZZZZ